MELKEIQNLIKYIVKSGAAEVYFKDEKIEINVKNLPDGSFIPMQNTVLPVPQNVGNAPMIDETITGFSDKPIDHGVQDESKYQTIKSPMIGTFYRKSAPDKPNFVEVGDTIKVGTVVCIIEAMKLFNEIESEISGKIVKILVDDASPVEYDQPLFLVDPS